MWKDAIRRIVPPVLLEERAVILRLGNTAGRVYAQLRVLDWLGFRRFNATTAPSASRNIVFVCFGNIMRSAMAEALLREALRSRGLPRIQVASAGLHATPGTPAHPWASVVANELGVSLANHRSRSITVDIVDQADALLAMDFQNKAELITRFPQAKYKIFMLSSYAEGATYCREIADPYLGNLDAAQRCFRVISTCVSNLASRLAAHNQKGSIESAVSN